MSHKDSNGVICGGCPPECEDAKTPHVQAGLGEAETGCCAARFGHGRFDFDADGNCIQEATCCAGKDCADDEPAGCDAHAPKPHQVIEVEAPFIGGRFPEKVAEARARKVKAATDALNGLITNDPQEARGKARLVTAGLAFEGGPDNSGKVKARVMVLERRVNPNNPDPEFHHVTPTAAEIAAVKAALAA